jgi:hypothetical protein
MKDNQAPAGMLLSACTCASESRLQAVKLTAVRAEPKDRGAYSPFQLFHALLADGAPAFATSAAIQGLPAAAVADLIFRLPPFFPIA